MNNGIYKIHRIISMMLILFILFGVMHGTTIRTDAQMSISQMTDVNIVDISPGSWAVFALDDEGYVWSWGIGDESGGRIARPVANNTTPTRVTQTADGGVLPRIKKVDNAADNGLFLDVNGDIWTYSRSNLNNIVNALGRAVSGTNHARPGKVTFPEGNVKIKEISAGSWGFKCIDTNGDIWSWGNGMNGSIGNGSTANTTTPERLLTDNDGNTLPKFKAVESSDFNNTACAMALSEDGLVYTWGNSTRAGGTLRPKLVENTPEGIKKIDSSNGGWGFLTENGDLYTWGDNGGLGLGYLGYGNINPSTIPVKLPAPSDGGTWMDFGMYAWSTAALSSAGTLYGCGYNEGNSHGFISYDLKAITNMTGIAGPIVSLEQGFATLSVLDSYGNMYVNVNDVYYYCRGRSGGQSVTNNAWVNFPQNKALIKSIIGDPAQDRHAYDSTRASLSVDLNKAATEVKYIILHPNDEKFEPGSPQLTVTDTEGTSFSLVTERSSFYDLTYADIEGKYYAKGTGERILLSPNFHLLSSANYANPRITEEIFERAYERSGHSSKGTMTAGNGNLSFTTGQVITDNCRIWVQTKNSSGTHRMVYEFDNFYKQAKVWHTGVKKDDSSFIIYNPELTPGEYGVYLDHEGNDISGEPRLGYDIVQPMPKDLTNIDTNIAYWILDPSNQMETSGSVDPKTGIQHRSDPDKEVILDSISKMGDTDTQTPRVTFTYGKNPDAWLDVTLKFVDEQGNPVTVGSDERTQETLLEFTPKGIAHIDGQSPYVPPEATDSNTKVVGYSVDTEPSLGYTACAFPDGFKPVITADNQTIYIVYESGMVQVRETFWDVTDDTQIKNNNGLFETSISFRKDAETYENGAALIKDYVAVGYEINGSKIMFDWEENEYKAVTAVIGSVSEDTNVKYLYKKDTDNNGIPDDEEGIAKTHWVGVSGGGNKISLHSTAFEGNGARGDTKTYFDDSGDKDLYITINPQKWILNRNASGGAYEPAGSDTPLVVNYEKGVIKDYYLYYDEDFNENGIPDKDEKLTEKFRLYGDYSGELKTDNVLHMLNGEVYDKTAPHIEGYVPVGWVRGDYQSGLSDEEIHHITENSSIPSVSFKTEGNETVTFIYREAAKPITVNWTGITYGGTVISLGTITINGYVDEDVTQLVFSPEPINPNLWKLEDSNVPETVILGRTAEVYEYTYKEKIDFADISVTGESVDGKLKFNYQQQKKLNEGAFEVSAWFVPDYRITGYTVMDMYGNELESGTGDKVVIDPSKGSQSVSFTYVSTITTVVLRSFDENGVELFSNVFIDANVGEKYSVIAPHMDGYTLNNGQDIIKVLDLVQEGTNIVSFHYTKLEEEQKTLILQETGGNIIKVIPVNEGETILAPPDLSNAYYSFDEQETNLTFPFVANESVTIYYTKDMMDATIKGIDTKGNFVGEDQTDKARKGEMYKAVANNVPGHTLVGATSKLVYADPFIEPFEVIFEYKADELGDLTVRYYYIDEKGDEVDLYTYTGKGIIGSKFTAIAGEFNGFELKNGETTEKEISVVESNLIEFNYTDIRKTVTIYTKLGENEASVYENKKYPAGSKDTIYPPHINGYVLIAYDKDGSAENVNETFTGVELTEITNDHTLTFIYKPLEDVIKENYVTLTVRGSDGENILYSYTTLVPKASETVIKASELTMYAIDANKNENYSTGDKATGTLGEYTVKLTENSTHTFYYTKNSRNIYIDAQVDGISIEGYPVYAMSGIIGEILSINAPFIPDYELVNAGDSVVPHEVDVDNEKNKVIFAYRRIQGNIVIKAVESGTDNVIGAWSDSAEIGNSYTAIPREFIGWIANTAPPLTITGGLNTVIIEYTKDMKDITVNYFKNGTETPVASPIIQQAQNGAANVTVIAMPTDLEPGYVLLGTPYQTVASVDGTNMVNFYYEDRSQTGAGAVTIIAKNKANGDIISYSVGAAMPVGASYNTQFPEITGWKNAEWVATSDEEIGIMSTSGVTVIYEYEMDTVEIPIYLIDESGSVLPEVTYIDITTKLYKTQTVQVGNDITIYAPHIEGYEVIEESSIDIVNADDTSESTFKYRSAPKPESGTLTITITSSSKGNVISGATVEIRNGDQVKTHTSNADGKVVITNAAFDSYTIKASYSGYNTGTTSATLSEDNSVQSVHIALGRTTISGGGGIVTTPPSAPETKPDDDTDLNKGIGEILETDKHIKYINGYPNGDIMPDNSVTRAEVAAIFFRLYKGTEKNSPIDIQFKDTDKSKWYSQAVNFLALKGILKGYGDGYFSPAQTITRAEFAAIASRFDELSEIEGVIFSDVPSEHWAARYIINAYDKGWINGYPNGKYEPNRSISRAEGIKIINSMLNRMIETADIPADVTQYNDLDNSHWAYRHIIEASTEHEYSRKDNGYEIWK